MGIYFLDTSAIVKYYCLELGQPWVQSLCNPIQKPSLFISQASRTEVVAAICRKAHSEEISVIERDKFISQFRIDCQRMYSIERVTNAIYASAGNLCRTYRLRAYDAIQLACALSVHKKALVRQAPSPIFVCADKRLVEFACAEGLTADNPENHPFSGEAE
jgi:predicted nucleic acid-binding protein